MRIPAIPAESGRAAVLGVAKGGASLRSLMPILLLAISSSAVAADRGFFGYALRTDFAGSFFNPVLEKAYVGEVVPGSPAAKAGLQVNDVVLQFEEVTVPGAKGDQLEKLKAILDTPAMVGDRRHLKLRRASGDEYSVTLIAGPRN